MIKNRIKKWFVKIDKKIAVIAGICGILGISVFGGKSLINDKTESALVNLKDNKINMEDQSAIVIGDNNTFNYGYTDSNNDSMKTSDKSSIDDAGKTYKCENCGSKF